MKKIRRWFGVLFVGLVGWSGLFWREEAQAEDTKVYRQEIVSLYQKGRALLEEKEYRQAVVKFLAAFDLLKRMEGAARTKKEKEEVLQNQIRFYFFLGRTYHLSRDFGPAAEYYRRCTLRSPESRPCVLAARYLREIRAEAVATIEITSQPSGAKVKFKDGLGEQREETTPLRIEIWPGRWTFSIQAPEGYVPLTRIVEIRPKAQVQVHYTLEKRGSLRRTPPPERRRGQEGQPPVERPSSWPVILAWTCVGLAVVAGVTGGILIGVSDGRFSQVAANLGRPETLSGMSNEVLWQNYGEAQGMQTGAIASFSIAGAAVLGAVGFFVAGRFLVTPSRPATARVPASASPSSSVFLLRLEP